MTKEQAFDFIERHGASVVPGTSETLLPESFSVCVGRVTGWHTKPTLKEAVEACELELRTNNKAMT